MRQVSLLTSSITSSNIEEKRAGEGRGGDRRGDWKGSWSPTAQSPAHRLGDELSVSGRGGQGRAAWSAVTQASLSQAHSGGQTAGSVQNKEVLWSSPSRGQRWGGSTQREREPSERGPARPEVQHSGIEGLPKAARSQWVGRQEAGTTPGRQARWETSHGGQHQPPSRAHGSGWARGPLPLLEPWESPLVSAPTPHPVPGTTQDSRE